MTPTGPAVTMTADAYYLRLLVLNDGDGLASDVQVYADRLEERDAPAGSTSCRSSSQ
jgi:hypothetical protein